MSAGGVVPAEPWVAAAAEDWPGPIAHEYAQLRRLMDDDQVVAAVLQFKDVVELLIKVPAIVMARDVIEHGGDAELNRQIRERLLARPVSLGDWHRLAVDVLPRFLLQPPPAACVLFPELASLFRTAGRGSNARPTELAATLLDLVNWRNEEIGHGVVPGHIHHRVVHLQLPRRRGPGAELRRFDQPPIVVVAPAGLAVPLALRLVLGPVVELHELAERDLVLPPCRTAS